MMNLKFLSVIIFFVFVVCQDQSSVKEPSVAYVAGKPVSLSEFRLFYELDPNFGLDSTGFHALLDELMKLIDQKKAYYLGSKEKLFRDSSFMRLIRWEKSRIILRSFYKNQISEKIEITEREQREAFQKMNVDVHVRHLFSKDYHEIKIWQERLSQGASFEKLAEVAFEDTVLAHRGGDLGWCSLWDLDYDFSTAIVGLQEKEISDIVETKWGYHIIQLLDRRKNMLLREEEFLQKNSEIEKLVRRRKERHLANTFIREFMEKMNPQPHSKNFRLLWEALTHGLHERGRLDYEMVLTEKRVEQLKIQLKDKLDDPLIQFGKKEVTIIDYLNTLQRIPESERPRFRTAQQLSNQIGIWMRDTLLLKEAYRLDVHQNDQVHKEFRQFKERQCYLYYLQEEIVNTDVPEEIRRYFQSKSRQNHRVLGKFHTVQEWIFWRAQINLHKRLRNLKVKVEIDSSLVKKESEEIDWNRQVRLFLIPKPA